MFTKYLTEIKANAPVDFVLNHLVGSFAEAVKWWIDNKMRYTPEETAKYYIEVSCAKRITDI
ncbi:MAG: TetR-like C-terminal domain-containing protein [Syntrophomonas sp.]|nr:TetR-like C-terminal domain-containing protein [Syntrophomonas sp.]